MASAGVTVDFLQAEFDAAMKKFVNEHAPEAVAVAIRKVAFDIVRNTMVGMGGLSGLPKRIDTGRLRAGWRMGLEALGINAAGLPPLAPNSEIGDGTGIVSSSGTTHTVIVSNNVEYARYVEDGTARMRPGNHLKRALIMARRSLSDPGPESLGAELKRRFEGG